MSWLMCGWLILYLLGITITDSAMLAFPPAPRALSRIMVDLLWPVFWVIAVLFVLVLRVDELRRARR